MNVSLHLYDLPRVTITKYKSFTHIEVYSDAKGDSISFFLQGNKIRPSGMVDAINHAFQNMEVEEER